MLEDPPEPGADLGTVASCWFEVMNHGYAHDVVTMRPSEVLRSVGPVSISGAGPFLPKGRCASAMFGLLSDPFLGGWLAAPASTLKQPKMKTR